MPHDTLIHNALLIDGSGAPAQRTDVALSSGRIEAQGTSLGPARKTIDASGLVLAPGFIDPHTHYDAQICWDGATTPSSWHGVTTVVMGNCGVGIAPCRPQTREVAMRDLVNVEAIPFEMLNADAPVDTVSLALLMGATFVARSFSGDKAQLVPLFKAAIAHEGAAFIDVISPCVAFNRKDQCISEMIIRY